MTTLFKVERQPESEADYAVLTDMSNGERHVVRTGPTRLERDDVWTTAAGRELRIEDMDTSHLRNTVRFLRRRAWLLHYSAIQDMSAFMAGPLGPGGDMATMAADAAFDDLCWMKPVDWLFDTPLVRAMLDEMILRDQGGA